MKNSIIRLTYGEMQSITGARNECGCIGNDVTGTVELCDAPSAVKCWELCCEIKGRGAYQWLNNKPEPCKRAQHSIFATMSVINPFVWVVGALLGEIVVSHDKRS